MNLKDAIQRSIDTGNVIAMGYLADLSEAEMFHLPYPSCNHVNWRVGHLIKL